MELLAKRLADRVLSELPSTLTSLRLEEDRYNIYSPEFGLYMGPGIYCEWKTAEGENFSKLFEVSGFVGWITYIEIFSRNRARHAVRLIAEHFANNGVEVSY